MYKTRLRKELLPMFEIKYTDFETMSNETQINFSKIEGIEEFIELQQLLYKNQERWICFDRTSHHS